MVPGIDGVAAENTNTHGAQDGKKDEPGTPAVEKKEGAEAKH
jgi:hypothetical protein